MNAGLIDDVAQFVDKVRRREDGVAAFTRNFWTGDEGDGDLGGGGKRGKHHNRNRDGRNIEFGRLKLKRRATPAHHAHAHAHALARARGGGGGGGALWEHGGGDLGLHDGFENVNDGDASTDQGSADDEYYEYYDDDQSGVLSYDQFRNVYRYMKESGYGVGEKTPEDIFSEIDTDSTESINYNEFIRWMVHLGVLEADGILRRDLSIEEIAKAAALPEGGGWAGVEKEEEEAGAAVGVGSGEGAKLCWPNLVGTGGESAVGIIQAERPDLVRVSVLEDGAMMTMDYREDRVRVMVDENGNVSQPPTVG